MDTHILAFGTSTTYGAWDTEGGWVQRFRKFLDEKYVQSNFDNDKFCLVYNLGVSGDTSTGILKRFESETQTRIDKKDQKVVILFHLGINDAIRNNESGDNWVSPHEFKENYKRLIHLAKKYSDTIIVVGSKPVDARVDPIPWLPDHSYKNEDVEKYNEIMEEVAKENGTYFIEMYKRFINKDYSNLLADGVHMNSEGHKQFFEVVKDFLIANELI